MTEVRPRFIPTTITDSTMPKSSSGSNNKKGGKGGGGAGGGEKKVNMVEVHATVEQTSVKGPKGSTRTVTTTTYEIHGVVTPSKKGVQILAAKTKTDSKTTTVSMNGGVGVKYHEEKDNHNNNEKTSSNLCNGGGGGNNKADSNSTLTGSKTPSPPLANVLSSSSSSVSGKKVQLESNNTNISSSSAKIVNGTVPRKPIGTMSTTTTTTMVNNNNDSKKASLKKRQQQMQMTLFMGGGGGGERSMDKYDCRNNCSCPCCGEIFFGESDYEDHYYTDSDYGYTTSDDSDLDSMDEDAIRSRNRVNQLLVHNQKARNILTKNKYYKKIIDTQKMIRERQLMVLQRASSLNAMFMKNMEVIIRLGFCPMVLQTRTDALSQGLLDVHKLIQNWDSKLEELIPVPMSKIPISVADLYLSIFKERYGTNIEAMTDDFFNNALKYCMDVIPQLLPDEESMKMALEHMEVMELDVEWDSFEQQVESQLLQLEKEFIDLCMEFGVRTPLPRISGCEWAHAIGSESRQAKHKRRRSSTPKSKSV